MNAAPQGGSHSAQPSMLQSIAEAISDRPADTAAQRAVRSGIVTAIVEGFQPRGPVEIMLAGMAVAHAYLLEDSVRDVFRGQDDRLKAQTKSGVVALGRGMFGFLKELRTIQAKRHVATAAKADDAAASVGSSDEMPIKSVEPTATEPKVRVAAAGPQVRPRTPEPPAPWSSPLHRAETR
jgi:hypothetical protein